MQSATLKMTIPDLTQDLERVEKLLNGPDVRPADFALRDRLVRRLQEANAALQARTA